MAGFAFFAVGGMSTKWCDDMPPDSLDSGSTAASLSSRSKECISYSKVLELQVHGQNQNHTTIRIVIFMHTSFSHNSYTQLTYNSTHDNIR